MKSIKDDLSKQLLEQKNSGNLNNKKVLKTCKEIAQNFADLENGIAVLSDLYKNKSYIYSGKISEELKIFKKDQIQEIESIWEEELFGKLNSDDVLQKYLLELHFFQFIKTVPVEERKDFCVISKLRMNDKTAEKSLLHKMFYFSNEYEDVELALCLYNFDFSLTPQYEGAIINTATGNIIKQNEKESNFFLSTREKEILKMLQEGKQSKEIAQLLFISINTVSRHRQNILEKMKVNNTAEACSIATKLKWI
ncbi:response regulator transcription factor [Flavobacterium sp. IB48]|uniref:response regulator transcription factor n=1 Tax=Flavobacterium sp. IB48 TaxID=2779375 RepID=UPI0018E8920B|nr:LuxR C-terminal-related transcriptional regulator [Flavobacterium sp. IB48]MBJ2126146.1 response regulator transcription factor [Flavobacterium sp. IB48]